MFKKAEKSELRTWCLGSLVIVVLCVVIAIAMIIDMATVEFKASSLIITCLAALFGFLFTKYMIAAYKAYKTFDERKKVQDEEEALKQAKEAKELEEKGFLTSSCCPTFVAYIKKNFPKLIPNISHNPSPMAALAKWIKENDTTAKVVFIGPCVSKKMEIKREDVAPYVDYVLTFEELQALIDSRNIDASSLEESPLDNASYFGRIFARVGGLSDAVVQALKEQESDFEAKSFVCDGIENFKLALLKAQSGKADFNFIEGMGCVGGCIGGPCCLTHEVKDKNEVDKYGKLSKEQTIKSAIRILG